MKKIQLHSNFTFFKKYILSVWMSFAALYLIFTTVQNENWLGLFIILLVANGIIYTIKKFLWPLRNVYFDSENKKLFVEYKKQVIEILTTDIEKIEEQSRLGKILNVKLNLTTDFGAEFIFIPKDQNVYSKLKNAKDKIA